MVNLVLDVVNTCPLVVLAEEVEDIKEHHDKAEYNHLQERESIDQIVVLFGNFRRP